LFEAKMNGEKIMNTDIDRMGLWVGNFVQDGLQQYSLFDSTYRADRLRKTVYNLRDKFGFEKIQMAAELIDKPVMKDVIGFGSIKDLTKPAYDSPKE